MDGESNPNPAKEDATSSSPEPAPPETASPQPASPQPVSPRPVSPRPVSPRPVSPRPVSPRPVSPRPVSPRPVSPRPVSPQPVSPQPVSPQPVSPQPVSPNTKEAATATVKEVEEDDDDVVLVEEESQDRSDTEPVDPPVEAPSPSVAPTLAEPIVIDDEEDSQHKETSDGASPSRYPAVLAEPASEIRISSVTTLGSTLGSMDLTDGDSPSQTEGEDMTLKITSVTSLQDGGSVQLANELNNSKGQPGDHLEEQPEEDGLQITHTFSLNSAEPAGSGLLESAVQNGDTHDPPDLWQSQTGSVQHPKQPTEETPAKPPSGTAARTVKVTCANCKKPLKKGQTAYQRKGSTHLFCSTTCLSAFSHKPAPKKSCTMCKKDITNMKGTIVAQVDSSESFQEFCSTGCLSAYESKQNLPKSGAKTKCTVCGKLTEIRHEVSFKTVTHKICSDSCFNAYRRANGLIMNCCEQCGDYLPHRNTANHCLLVDGQQKRFCCHNCIRDFRQAHSKLATCVTCKTLIKTGEVLHSIVSNGTMGSYCSSSCMNKGKTSPPLNSEPQCHFCKRNALPQYQATLPEGAILSFCSSQCVTKFQDSRLPSECNGRTAPSADGRVQLRCNYCRGAFSLKPELLEWEEKVFQFCSKACCDDYKKLHCIVTFCEFCQEEKTLHETVQFSGVKRPFCSEGCKLLYKQDFVRRLGLRCVSCNHCGQLCKKGVTQTLGGMVRDFCTEACSLKFHDWFFKAARCDCCKVQGALTEAVMWRSEMKHFCDQLCLLRFYSQQNDPIMETQKGPENCSVVSSTGAEVQATKLGVVSANNVSFGGLLRDVKNKAVLCKPLTLTKATYCKPHMQSKHLQTDVNDGLKREFVPVPIPVPVFVPMPMNMYSQVTPAPLPLPVPVPIPVCLLGGLSGTERVVQSLQELKEQLHTEVTPELMEAKPERTEAKPERTEAEPELTEAKPELTEAKPELTEAKPELTEAKPERTGAKPERTEAKPERTGAKPERTGAKPERTEAKPERTGAKRELTEAKPERTGAKPERTEAKRELTEAKPERTGAKRELTEAKPERTEAKRELTEAKPERTEAKRELTEAKPERRGAKPERTGAKPERAEAKPERMEAKPERMEAKPERAEAKPERMEAKPERTEAKPERMEAKPERMEAKPERMEAKPERMEAKPERTEAKPERTGAKPERTEAKPERTEAKPERTEAKPERTGAKRELTEAEPERTESKPERTGAKPERTGAKPERTEAEREWTGATEAKSEREGATEAKSEREGANPGRMDVKCEQSEAKRERGLKKRDRTEITPNRLEAKRLRTEEATPGRSEATPGRSEATLGRSGATPGRSEELRAEVKEKQCNGDSDQEDQYEPELDLEEDFCPGARPVPDFGEDAGPAAAMEQNQDPSTQLQPRTLEPKRRVLEVASGRLQLPLKSRYGLNAWRRWTLTCSNQSPHTKDQATEGSSRSLLELSCEQLNAALCSFVKEVCRPNGERYSPDSVLYLCLGLQKHLQSRGRGDDLFGDSCYQPFVEELSLVLRGWRPPVLRDGSLWGRVEEQTLWSSGQLGSQSPASLLRSLVYLNTKYLRAQSVEQHLQLSFARVYATEAAPARSGTEDRTETSPCPLVPSVSQDLQGNERGPSRKRKLEQEELSQVLLSLVTERERPLLTLYRDKSPEALRDSPDTLYLLPVPRGSEGGLWFTSSPLPPPTLHHLLTRALLVRELHQDNQGSGPGSGSGPRPATGEE